MTTLTKELIFAYDLGWVTDPELLHQIEEARESDPIVQYWFDLVSDNGLEQLPEEWKRLAERQMVLDDDEPVAITPSANDRSYTHRVAHDIAKRMAAKSGDMAPPVLRPFPELPSQEIDPDDKMLRMTYWARELPFGVARVTAEAEGKETFRRLVVFPQFGEGEKAIRQAEVRLEDLGVPLKNPPKTTIFVVFAVEENLDEFPLDQVTKLAEECNGNYGHYLAVQSLVERLNRGGQS